MRSGLASRLPAVKQIALAALRERTTITSEKATTDAKIYPHGYPANDTPLLKYKRNFINGLRLIPPRYRDEDSARSRMSELGKGCGALTKAVVMVVPPKARIASSYLLVDLPLYP